MFYGILDFEKHVITYCNAGHDRPVYMKKGVSDKDLSVGGIPLGYIPDFEYEDEGISFESGSGLILYSDGITEAMNQEEEEFGLERLKELICNNFEKSSEEISKIIIDQVGKFSAETEQMDDMTLLVLKRDS
jgi:sigma-B regulation protein RsbU (phosphoserine phosphatase)